MQTDQCPSLPLSCGCCWLRDAGHTSERSRCLSCERRRVRQDAHRDIEVHPAGGHGLNTQTYSRNIAAGGVARKTVGLYGRRRGPCRIVVRYRMVGPGSGPCANLAYPGLLVGQTLRERGSSATAPRWSPNPRGSRRWARPAEARRSRRPRPAGRIARQPQLPLGGCRPVSSDRRSELRRHEHRPSRGPSHRR
jgi:hypothetical protein